MKKVILGVASMVMLVGIYVGVVFGKNPYSLSNTEIEELLNNINNEVNVQDIPVLQDKVVVVDENWNVILERPLEAVLQQNVYSKDRQLVRRSEFLMENAGTSFYLLEE